MPQENATDTVVLVFLILACFVFPAVAYAIVRLLRQPPNESRRGESTQVKQTFLGDRRPPADESESGAEETPNSLG